MTELIEEVLVERNIVMERPTVKGKFLYVGEEKFWAKAVSYGTFATDEKGNERLIPEVVERDFSRMAENGFNVVRTYTAPPLWVLDTALRHGLRVMVGLWWPGHMVVLDEPGKRRKIEDRVREQIRTCARHPALFCYSIGNEIPASIVRWHGRRRVEKFLKRLYRVAKEEDPNALVTYVNFPTTEYLRLPFLDLVSFNVYLESKQALTDYIARLHSLSGERPLLLAEVGFDSLRNGEEKQAETLDWQVRTAFRLGCCGVVVFAWTDEWYTEGGRVEDWRFGLTDRGRTPKPALEAVKRALAESPFSQSYVRWPKISVVVCSFNGASTIQDTLDGLARLDYPDFEVIVVDDGSTDSTSKIASEYPFRLIRTENRGLSQSRNTGIQAGQGEIIAFIDDDAYPEIHWLRFLALALMEGNYVGVGGPNLSPPNDGWKADSIANAPGPNPVLLSDKVAEHIPGCNMAFTKDALNAVGGFDPIFRVAGDDVDLCWRLQDRGWVIGFSPSATVWHHRRKSFQKYWKQQVGYGKAEALLERKWPERYNTFGHSRWLGRIYGRGISLDFSSLGGRIYQGVWGTAPFQSLYSSSNSLWSLTLMPEWYLVIALLSLLLGLSIGWGAWTVFGALLLLVIALPVAEASMSARQARFASGIPKTWPARFRLQVATLFLHLLQPLARLVGRIDGGLTPWRRHGKRARAQFLPLTMTLWRHEWKSREDTLRGIQAEIRGFGAIVRSGDAYDSWDFEVHGGLFGSGRLRLAMEEHGGGRQLLHFRIFPRYSRLALGLTGMFLLTSVAAGLSGAWGSAAISGVLAILITARASSDAGYASGILRELLRLSGAS